MAKETTAQKNGGGAGPRSTNNSSMDEVLKDADRILNMVLIDSSPIDTAQTGQKQSKPRATVAGQRPHKRTSEDRRRSSSPLETKEASKKRKNALEDDGSRCRDDDDDDASRGHSKSKGDEEPVEETRRGNARKLTIPGVGGRAPLAEPEDSTVTPEPESDVGRIMGFLKCRSQSEGDEVDGDGCDIDEDDYDDVDGISDAEEPIDEKERVLEEIAMKLRNLGDALNSQIAPGTMTKSASTLSISMMALDGIQDLVSNLTYEQFQDAVNRNMGNEPAVQQMTVMFRLASAAVRHLGCGTRAAGDLKQIAMTYFRQNVASWVSQNGWEGIAQRL